MYDAQHLMKEVVDAHVDVTGNAVHLSATLAGDDTAAIAAHLHHLKLLELVHGLADDGTAGSAEVSLAGSPVGTVGSAIPLLQGTDTSSLAKVHLTSDGGRTDEEPVLIVWGKLPGDTSLHDVVVLRDIELRLTLQVIGTGLNELISWNILYGNTTARGKSRHIVAKKSTKVVVYPFFWQQHEMRIVCAKLARSGRYRFLVYITITINKSTIILFKAIYVNPGKLLFSTRTLL